MMMGKSNRASESVLFCRATVLFHLIRTNWLNLELRTCRKGQKVLRSYSAWNVSFRAGLDNMSSSEEFYPFDGECARSWDADFTLTFDDKSCLKISKSLLQLASPVLKAAIGECQHNGTLHLLDTSIRTWILILNYIHPAGRSVSLADAIIKAGWESTADVLKQCEKFGFVSLKEDMDGRLAKAVEEMHPALQRLTGSLKIRYILVDPDMVVIKAVKEFDLPKSEDAVVAHLIAVAQDSINQTTQDTAAGTRRDSYNADAAKQRIVRILNEMHDAGRYKLCSKFMQEAIKKIPFLANI